MSLGGAAIGAQFARQPPEALRTAAHVSFRPSRLSVLASHMDGTHSVRACRCCCRDASPGAVVPLSAGQRGCRSHTTRRAQGCRSHTTRRAQGCRSHTTRRARGCRSHTTRRAQGCRSHTTRRVRGCRSHTTRRARGCTARPGAARSALARQRPASTSKLRASSRASVVGQRPPGGVVYS